MNPDLSSAGFRRGTSPVGAATRNRLRVSLFPRGVPGTRCLLDLPDVREVALDLGEHLAREGFLPRVAPAIQAIAFDKSVDANWKVTWHQDLLFPLARPAVSPGYSLACTKEGVDFARPPRRVLEELLAVRLHLDPCHADRGPLRVAPGTHRRGVVPVEAIASLVAEAGEVACLAEEGDLLLMRPLLLHASSKATQPSHRRVLHLVYHAGPPPPESWHRTVRAG